jgi:hypothetical protein
MLSGKPGHQQLLRCLRWQCDNEIDGRLVAHSVRLWGIAIILNGWPSRS